MAATARRDAAYCQTRMAGDMSYAGISVREALERLNVLNSGWYLPNVQRQYVWGARYESETFVCLLIDSLLKKYPIGGIVLWETESPVAYRRFLDDYEPNKPQKLVEEGRWGAHKFLIYDGQQRLQTLRSVLGHTFNGRVLYFDLLFDSTKEKSDETGFLFRNKGALPDPKLLKMTELASMQCDASAKVRLEYRLLESLRAVQTVDMNAELLVRANLAELWEVFVDTNQKSIAYFSVKADNEAVVNEVFRRLNTGGIALNQIELLLGKIKSSDPGYEERLWDLEERIRGLTSIKFSSAQILQFFFLLERKTTRIDSSSQINAGPFITLLADSQPLAELFENYLYGLFKINHESIIPRWLAVLPIAVYLMHLKQAGKEWRIKALTADQIRKMHSYFLSAQFCDWNTQTMVNAFAQLAADAGAVGADFPFEDVRQIAIQKNRTGSISHQQFLALPWFATKILTPDRVYVFHENKPQVDHIFPIALAGEDDSYRQLVDVLWNFQPIPDGINNFKRAKHPRDFFTDPDTSRYWLDYDFLPNRDSEIWNDPKKFIDYREEQMRRAFATMYDLTID
jgi:hypothetical protein